MRPYLPVCLPAISSSGRHLVRLRHGSNGGAWGVASDAVCPEKDVDRWISLLLVRTAQFTLGLGEIID